MCEITPEMIRAAVESVRRGEYPRPCGSEAQPHLVHPDDYRPGAFALCVNCGATVEMR